VDYSNVFTRWRPTNTWSVFAPTWVWMASGSVSSLLQRYSFKHNLLLISGVVFLLCDFSRAATGWVVQLDRRPVRLVTRSYLTNRRWSGRHQKVLLVNICQIRYVHASCLTTGFAVSNWRVQGLCMDYCGFDSELSPLLTLACSNWPSGAVLAPLPWGDQGPVSKKGQSPEIFLSHVFKHAVFEIKPT